MAEVFVPGLAELWHPNLVSGPRTNEYPILPVIVRTILLAGMATAFDDRPAALCVFKSASSPIPNRDFGPLIPRGCYVLSDGFGIIEGNEQSRYPEAVSI